MSRLFSNCLATAAVLSLLAASSIAGEPLVVAPLLKTQWGQRGDYAAFAPGKQRLGCWSTAIAQILRHHKLQPRGRVEYRTSAGTALSLDLDRHSFEWNRLASQFGSRTPVSQKRPVAAYSYCVSLVVQKDFGTGTYVLGHRARATAVSKHYDCVATLHETPGKSLEELGKLIKSELVNKRPVMMHIRSRKKAYHAVAVDGYAIRNGVLFIHINMGHGGKGNGLYRADAPISTYDDLAYRKIMTIVPR